MRCPDGGIGRRAGLKHQWQQCCAGSIPAPGTESPVCQLITGFFLSISNRIVTHNTLIIE